MAFVNHKYNTRRKDIRAQYLLWLTLFNHKLAYNGFKLPALPKNLQNTEYSSNNSKKVQQCIWWGLVLLDSRLFTNQMIKLFVAAKIPSPLFSLWNKNDQANSLL